VVPESKAMEVQVWLKAAKRAKLATKMWGRSSWRVRERTKSSDVVQLELAGASARGHVVV